MGLVRGEDGVVGEVGWVVGWAGWAGMGATGVRVRVGMGGIDVVGL